MDIPPIIQQISDVCQQYGGTVYVVGGSVRDFLIKKEPNDWDLEVHNMNAQQLSEALHTVGKNKRVGHSFSVFKMHIQGQELDIALPQNKESDDPHMGITPALRRRDLTINAIAYNICTRTLIDPFHGKKDIHDRVLRATDPHTFIEDPLRCFRVAQFSARFNMSIDPKLTSLCLKLSLASIPKERIQIELHKLWLASKKPSIGLLALQSLELYQYLPLWASPTHPDILRSVDAYARLRDQHELPEQLIIFWICALQKTPCSHIEIFLGDLKIYTKQKVDIHNRIISFLTHYPALFQHPTNINIRQFSEYCSLSFAVSVMKILHNSQHPNIILIQKRAKELHLWKQQLPQLIPPAKLMSLGYVGKNIGIALREIREQQIQGKLVTQQDAFHYLQNKTS